MKTTLDGVVFLLPHVSGHAKTEFHRRRIFPGPREGRGNGMRRPAESCRTRTVGRQDGTAKRDGRTVRQDGAAGRGSRKRGGGQSRVIAADRSGGAARTNKKTGGTDGLARFSTGIPTAGSRRTAKKRTEKRPGICKRPMHRFSIRCSDTGKGAILSARPPLVK